MLRVLFLLIYLLHGHLRAGLICYVFSGGGYKKGSTNSIHKVLIFQIFESRWEIHTGKIIHVREEVSLSNFLMLVGAKENK